MMSGCIISFVLGIGVRISLYSLKSHKSKVGDRNDR
jgi:hypothetical protein